MRLSALGVPAKTGSPIRNACGATGDCPPGYEHPDRLLARDTASEPGGSIVSNESNQPGDVDRLLVGAAQQEAITRAYLDTLVVIEIDKAIAERAIGIRRKHRMKLPDAIIWATAQAQNLLLVTRNTKDFPASDPGVRIPYVLP